MTGSTNGSTVSNSNVIQIPPKSKNGTRKNAKWYMTYRRAERDFIWSVEVTLKVQTFTGVAATEAEAMERINDVLQRLAK